MAAGRLHEPTAHRLARARRAGDVPRSAVLVVTAVLSALATIVVVRGAELAAEARAVFASCLTAIAEGRGITELAVEVLARTASAIAEPLAVLFAVALCASLVQGGGAGWFHRHAASDPPAAARLGAWDRARGHVVAVCWAALVLLAATLALLAIAHGVLAGPAGGLPALQRSLGAGLGVVAGWALLALACAAALDLLWQRALHRRGLRMTDRELDDERRQLEADPALRAERRRLAGTALASDAVAVRDAELVVVSATGLLVALQRLAGPDAPAVPIVSVIARGLPAQRLLVSASSEEAPVRDDALAEALGRLRPGDRVPRHLFAPVARHLRGRRAA